MSNLLNYPLEDNFSTTLSQEWTGGTGTVYVASTPSFTFPSGKTTYIVVNPGKSNMQIARINAYDSSAKTLTVSSITVNKGASTASTAQTHAVGSKVIISDNFQFWEDLATAINSKVDGDTQPFPSYSTSGRDALSASNGMMIYNTTTGEFNVYQGGAWVAVSSGSTQANSSTTVAGKVETATSAETIAGTDTGGTGANLMALPSDIAKNTQSSCFTHGADVGGDDTYVVALTPTLAAYTTGQTLTAKLTTANTGACTIDFGPGVKNIKMPDGTDPLTGDILANSVQTFVYDGTSMILQPQFQRASTSDATTGTNTVKMMVPSTVKDSIKDSVGITTQFASSSSNSYDTGDQTASTGLWVTVNLDSTGAGSRAYATCNVGAASPSALIGRISTSADSNVPYGAFTFPVTSGYHWQVVITGTGSTNTTYIRTTPMR